MSEVHSFPPLVSTQSRVLVLGSMPGVASLRAQQYYAHPRNAFWPIICALCGGDVGAPYEARIALLLENGLALWDVAGVCVRPGSLDAAIQDASVVANDIAGLLRTHPGITRVCLNGTKAAQLFERHITPRLGDWATELEVLRLPSTSPAHAARSFDDKRQAWAQALTLDGAQARCL